MDTQPSQIHAIEEMEESTEIPENDDTGWL